MILAKTVLATSILACSYAQDLVQSPPPPLTNHSTTTQTTDARGDFADANSYLLPWNWLFHPLDTSNSFLDDFRLALSPSARHARKQARHQTRRQQRAAKALTEADQGDLMKRQDEDAQVPLRKCRLKSNVHSPGNNDGVVSGTTIPGMTPTDSNGMPLPTQTVSEGHGGGGKEVIEVTTACNGIPVGATVDIQQKTGPNGSLDWLTCGINRSDNSSTWQPPMATIEQIITVEGGLVAAMKTEGSPYQACEPYVDLFEAAGGEFKIPPLFLAAFALQESGCNPLVEGQGGEQGMMQLSQDKCGEAPNGNCLDAWYNVRTAASYFRNVLDGRGGNVFEAVGMYNGWFKGMSFAEGVTWGINGDCCRCQRNLDYLHQFFNGWLQGRSAWSEPRLGSFFNTDICT